MSNYWWCGRCTEKVTYHGCGCHKGAASPWWQVPTGWDRVRCFFRQCPHIVCIYCFGWDEIRRRFKDWRNGKS